MVRVKKKNALSRSAFHSLHLLLLATMSSTTTPSDTALDTHDLLDPNTQSFVITPAQNLAIQRYIGSANTFTISADAATRYPDLAKFYADYKSHVPLWKPIQDDIQKLASDIVYYGNQNASYLPEILKYLQNQPSIVTKPEDIPQAIDDLHKLAVQYEGEAEALRVKVENFTTLVEGDYNTNTTLLNTYSAQLTQLRTDIGDDEKLVTDTLANIKSSTAEYDRLCLAAETSPVYLVIPFYGIFVSVTVAAVTGALAASTLSNIECMYFSPCPRSSLFFFSLFLISLIFFLFSFVFVLD